MVTVVAPLIKPVPVIVTGVSASVGPNEGEIDVSVGATDWEMLKS